MGSATAWWLARRGHEVVLLERFEQGHCNGSSHGGSRIFRFAYEEPDYARLAVEALPLWRELGDTRGRTLVDKNGRGDHGIPAAGDHIADPIADVGALCERAAFGSGRQTLPALSLVRAV